MSTHNLLFPLFGIVTAFLELTTGSGKQRCRNQPGSPSFPAQEEWDRLNSQVGGNLVSVVPTVKFCHSSPSGNCTPEEWASTTFRGRIPGAMDSVGILRPPMKFES